MHSRHVPNLKINIANIKTDNFVIKYTDAETSVVPCIPGTGDSVQRKFMIFHKLSQK